VPSGFSEAACRWCGSTLVTTVDSSHGYCVQTCSDCGTGNTVPVPSGDDLESAYAAWYRPPEGRFCGAGDGLLRRSRTRIAGWIDGLAPPGPILDVGSGDGCMLDAWEGRGRRAIGLERSSTRDDVWSKSLSDCSGNWSAIVLWHSLEHLPDPRRAVAEAASRLLPGGILVIAVPNLSSLQARAFGPKWLHLDLPRHLVHMPADNLLSELSTHGLVVTKVSYLRGGQIFFGWLHGLVGCLPGSLDLYQAIRRTTAQERPSRRWAAGIAAVALAPVAALAAGFEVAVRRGGTVCIVAHRVESSQCQPPKSRGLRDDGLKRTAGGSGSDECIKRAVAECGPHSSRPAYETPQVANVTWHRLSLERFRESVDDLRRRWPGSITVLVHGSWTVPAYTVRAFDSVISGPPDELRLCIHELRP
jgi:SAM-dependent methyltransferase